MSVVRPIDAHVDAQETLTSKGCNRYNYTYSLCSSHTLVNIVSVCMLCNQATSEMFGSRCLAVVCNADRTLLHDSLMSLHILLPVIDLKEASDCLASSVEELNASLASRMTGKPVSSTCLYECVQSPDVQSGGMSVY